jgi:hypothetical protein
MEIGLKGNNGANSLRYSFCNSSHSVAELQKSSWSLIARLPSHQRPMYGDHVNGEEIETQKLIAHFMSASAPAREVFTTRETVDCPAIGINLSNYRRTFYLPRYMEEEAWVKKRTIAIQKGLRRGPPVRNLAADFSLHHPSSSSATTLLPGQDNSAPTSPMSGASGSKDLVDQEHPVTYSLTISHKRKRSIQ